MTHSYLTKEGWKKTGPDKRGREIACLSCPRLRREASSQAVAGDLSSTVGVFAGVNAVNNYIEAFNIETNTIFSDSESMRSRRKINQGFGKMQGIAGGNI